MILRSGRIAAFTATFTYFYYLSHQASLARGNDDLPGMLWAIGVLSTLFSVRAMVSEWSPDGPTPVQKDFLWGLGASGFITIVGRNLGVL